MKNYVLARSVGSQYGNQFNIAFRCRNLHSFLTKFILLPVTSISAPPCMIYTKELVPRLMWFCLQHMTYAPIKSKLQLPPPPTPGQIPGIWPFSVPGEWGIWFARPSRRWGFDLCLGVVGKIEPEVSGSFFFSGAEVANMFRRDGIN